MDTNQFHIFVSLLFLNLSLNSNTSNQFHGNHIFSTNERNNINKPSLIGKWQLIRSGLMAGSQLWNNNLPHCSLYLTMSPTNSSISPNRKRSRVRGSDPKEMWLQPVCEWKPDHAMPLQQSLQSSNHALLSEWVWIRKYWSLIGW